MRHALLRAVTTDAERAASKRRKHALEHLAPRPQLVVRLTKLETREG
jgi:hypothetical protein